MKGLIMLIGLCLFSTNLFAQHRVYCEIVEITPSSKNVKISIDFGQRRKIGKKSPTLF